MGIWGVDAFANDDALDWLTQLEPADGLSPVVRELRGLEAASDTYLDAHTATVALAAAELIAALNGRAHPALPAAAKTWVAAQGSPPDAAPDTETLALATRALDYAVTTSQLSELWSQRAEDDRWRAELDDLRMRLSL